MSRDLDGDGVPERISFEAAQDDHGNACCEFFITVNGTTYTYRGINVVGPMMVVDVDSTDSYLELAVSEHGPSSDEATYFFRYSGGTLVKTGELPGCPQADWRPLVVDGSGVVIAHCRGEILQTWYYPCKYDVGPSGFLERIYESSYPMGTDLTVLQDFKLVAASDASYAPVELHPGDKITVLSSDDRHWCLVETKDGKRGWFSVTGFSRLADGRSAHEVFEGLSSAD
jgi:hypothetical protein